MIGLKRLLLGLAVVLASTPLSASPMLVFQPTATALDLGDAINVDVIVTGLGDRHVAAYDVTVGWDDSVLSLQDIAFDRFLGGPENSISGSLLDSASVSVFEVSLGSWPGANDAGLNRLFSLRFMGVGLGLSGLRFSSVLLGDSTGTLLSAVGSIPGEVMVRSRPTSVPEPGMSFLLAIGLAGLAISRRRRRGRP